ncbi:hypothetical protein FACS1894170_01090 [Planctomycetales bacterium]|nr:hypothetical protein FACS1894170_01090 [Planctomycetales bacterium]
MRTWANDADINHRGGMILWDIDAVSKTSSIAVTQSDSGIPILNYLLLRYPKAEVLPEPMILPYKTGAQVSLLRVGVAVVKPPLP